MDGYKDSVIPPLSEFSPFPGTAMNEEGSSSRKRSKRAQAKNPESLHKERDRREKMTEKYSVLQSMVPSLMIFPKATRERIVSDTIEYIKRLEEEKERLEGVQKALPMKSPVAKPVLSHFTDRNSSVNVSFSGGAAFFGIQLAFQRSLVVEIFRVFEKHMADVLAANVSVDDRRQLILTVTALLGGNGYESIEKIKREILSL
ncbi:unnamed protein product [Ilex paraguariensis]|uniref:BHLH domain-containing protein n=1 Tax=Ilex paraguariensis TaxID=185542 RepID=A0ABC8RLV2_9AQUA